MNAGDIYVYMGDKCQVLMFDDREVIYDFLTDDNNLQLGKRRTAFYYRTTRNFFDSNSTLEVSAQLSEREISIHRPELPLRLNCFRDVFWTHELIESLNEFSAFLSANGISEVELEGLRTDKVVIYPQGQQNSTKNPILLETDGESFTGIELVFSCFKIQREYVRIEKPYFSSFGLILNGREEKRLSGIGIYRLGIKGNIPSYYLGGYMSLLELGIDDSLIV